MGKVTWTYWNKVDRKIASNDFKQVFCESTCDGVRREEGRGREKGEEGRMRRGKVGRGGRRGEEEGDGEREGEGREREDEEREGGEGRTGKGEDWERKGEGREVG